MKKLRILLVLTLMVGLFSGFMRFSAYENKIAYPSGYRDWTHVKSSIVGPGSPAAPKYEGFTHIYANTLAMTGYKTGNFPNGSMIVFEVLKSVENKNGIIEGERKFIDVMVRDSISYASTGGWGFEEFNHDTKDNGILTVDQKAGCFRCHNSQKERSFVFSNYRQ